jgi:hypothetical protein
MSIAYNYKKVNLLLFGLVLIFNFLVLVSCQDNRLRNIEEQINNYILQQRPQLEFELRLDTIYSFEWNELLIAGPYTDLEEIEGYNFNKFSNSIKSHDRFTFFGFITDKKGVKWIELNGAKIYEDLLKGGKKGYKTYSKKNCVFRLTK